MLKLKKFLSYYRPYKGLFTAVLISSVFVAALALILPIMVRYITGTLLESGDEDVLINIIRIGIAMLVIVCAQTFFGIFYDYKGHDVGAKMERDMRKELFEHYQKMSLSFYDNEQIGHLMSRLSNDLHDLSEMLHHTPENIVMYGTQFLGSLIILFVINWQLASIICVLLILMIFYAIPFYHKMNRGLKKNRAIIGEVNNFVQENLSGIRVVKSFASEQAEIAKFDQENERYYHSRRKIYKYESAFYQPIEFFFQPLITITIVIVGSIWIYSGNLAITDLLIFVMYANYLTAPIPSLAFMISQAQTGLINYSRFREMMEIMPEIQDAEDAISLEVTKGEVCFDAVVFRYQNEGENVLRQINLNIKAGETVAIVGPSGIGKTTLCALIPRFYDVNEGAITIDGMDVRHVTQESLRKQIGIVRQETFLFAGTVLENILYGKPNASEAEAIEAAKNANAHDFIMSLPNGYHTDIGQRGVRLSGGQQQRLSIARVFLKNPPILIFDEATSALDYESEQAVMASLGKLTQDRTTFIIAHRLSTVSKADRILVMKDGCIVEEGTHEALCEMDSEYAKLYQLQM